MQDYPNLFKDLVLMSQLKKNLLQLNNSLAMASVGMDRVTMNGWDPSFKIKGKLYHAIGSLQPGPRNPNTYKYAQLFFLEPQEQQSRRASRNPNLDEEVLLQLQEWLMANNSYVTSFKTALEIMGRAMEVVLDEKVRPSEEHRRRYNLPESCEIAVIIPGTEHVNNLDIRLYHRTDGLQKINELHRSYDPLCYVLIHPKGGDGYHRDIPHKVVPCNGRTNGAPRDRPKTVTASQYTRFRLQVRDPTRYFNQVLRLGKLTQQYMCDGFARQESGRMNYVRYHQKEIRAEKYSCAYDALHHEEGREAVGKMIILPPTITGSPRWYKEAFHDSMAVVRQKGCPDLFITFTCNPEWPEVKESLYPDERSSDRPDIICRVFNMKLQAMIDDIAKKHVLGRCKGYFGMVEYQKRGLPHAHLLFFLDERDKPRTPEEVNKLISAEIPDPLSNPRLHSIITTNNLHGPCGPINGPRSPCMKDKKSCEKKYPKPFNSNTRVSQTDNPEYRRRVPEGLNNERFTHTKGRFTFDNSWVVPYNPFLSLKYNAHINCELVFSTKSVKYIHKYITKGSDRTMVRIRPEGDENANVAIDEISQYVDARHIGATEAVWRTFEFPLRHAYPSVEKLPLHLENEQQVLFQEGGLEEAVMAQSKTKLTAFFDVNAAAENPPKIIYPEVFKYYTWNGRKKTWMPRVQNRSRNCRDDPDSEVKSDTVGRLPIIGLTPNQIEHFHLRMLLYQVLAPTSFDNLRTYDGVTHATYQGACMARGLIDDDTEMDKAMDEAASVSFGQPLRLFFVQILLNAKPSNCVAFWERHKHDLMEDLLRRHRLSEPTEAVVHAVLRDVDEMLRAKGQSNRQLQLPEPNPELANQLTEARVLQEERHFRSQELEAMQEAVEQVPELNPEQRHVYDTVRNAALSGEGGVFALDAPGGTGKTHIIKLLLASLRREGHIALATATSGIAATLLPSGRTMHSRCAVPIKNLTSTSTCNMSRADATGKLMKESKLLIIDEITMAHKHAIEAIDRTLQDVRLSQQSFGGLCILMAGDWRQILPVVKRGGRPEIVSACIKRSDIWAQAQILHLTTNMRVLRDNAGPNERTFAEELLRIGEGKVPRVLGHNGFTIELDAKYALDGNSIKTLCDAIYGTRSSLWKNGEWLCERSILCPTNHGVDNINNLMTRLFEGNARIYTSRDSVSENQHLYPVEFLNSICLSGMASHRIVLKKGMPIMLLRNLDPANGHCNGSRYVVEDLKPHMISAKLITGPNKGSILLIPRIHFSNVSEDFPFTLTRKQFPVRPCFAMTANKAQGQSLKKVGINLKEHQMFSHGQLYVAMSRASKDTDIKIFGAKPHPSVPGKILVENVVYPEIL
ncbi:ATP-dependent DNA helicase [Caligus rogercresseyi]|uniref:ATP-dependent DNA helicase n=1 Tax=Caligus rogercresseyi TaxID=217165 RepID=A0A7T8GTG0_CALRO|nr:ATP-dependent DNA helicase [Caligus rogercresseyi]